MNYSVTFRPLEIETVYVRLHLELILFYKNMSYMLYLMLDHLGALLLGQCKHSHLSSSLMFPFMNSFYANIFAYGLHSKLK